MLSRVLIFVSQSSVLHSLFSATWLFFVPSLIFAYLVGPYLVAEIVRSFVSGWSLRLNELIYKKHRVSNLVTSHLHENKITITCLWILLRP